MKRIWKKAVVMMMAFTMLGATMITAAADTTSGKLERPFVSLGADLKASEREKVLDLLGITEGDLANYDVVEVTNEDEHKYLGEYLSASIIGSRALSSVIITAIGAGEGIHVTTENITYCTPGMYQNALVTAGVEDANVKVVGPFAISGTAGLVGAVKAYEVMTGEEVPEDALDAANNELVLTSEVAEIVGDTTKAEKVMALIKQEVVDNNLKDKDSIMKVIDEACSQVGVEITAENKQKIVGLMGKIGNLDLDVDTLKQQAKEIYDTISNIDFNLEDLGIDTEEVGNFFLRLWNAIVEFFRNLFS